MVILENNQKAVKLSILVTFYNQEKYVDQALSSILSQETNFNFEILVGDDGSTDSTVKKVQAWQDKYPGKMKISIMDRNQNKKYNSISRASKNRINLIKQAYGEYIAFLDGDDFYTDNKKLQTQIDILDDPKNADCIGCAHNVDYLYEETNQRKPLITKVLNSKITIEEYWPNLYFPNFSFVFRNIFKQNFPAFCNQNYFDDNLITFYMLGFGSIFYIDQSMSCYRQVKNSIWNNKSEMEQQILNLIDYDIELQIYPKYKNLSMLRHLGNYKFLYKNKARIMLDLIDKYLDCITIDKCHTTLKFLKYQNSSFIQKFLIRLEYYYFLIRKYNISYKGWFYRKYCFSRLIFKN